MVRFADLLDRRCNILRRVTTGRDVFNDREEEFEVLYSNVPCRREPSEATDNVALNIGGGEQLRFQEIFWFLPSQDIEVFDQIQLLPRSGDPQMVEITTYNVLASDALDMVNRVHHKQVEATKVLS